MAVPDAAAEPIALAAETRPRAVEEPAPERERVDPGRASEPAAPELTPEELVRRLGRPPRVRDVIIRRNGRSSDIGDDELIAGLATRPASGWWLWRKERRLDTVALERDRRRIETYYHARGWFSAEVTRVRLRQAGRDRVDVIFTVEEGAPSLLADVLIEGAPEPPTGALAEAVADRPAVHEAALRRRIGLEPGERFVYQRYATGKELIEQALRLAGFAHAEVRGRVAVDREARRAGVRYQLDPGPRVRFGEVRVRGLETLPESVVRRRVAWSPGEVFDPRAVIETRRNLQALRRFQSVRIELASRVPGPVADIRVTAVEALPREVRLGLGVGLDPVHWEVRGRAGYRVFGVPDALSTFAMELRPAYAYAYDDRPEADELRGFVGQAEASVLREDLFLPLLRGQTQLAYTLERFEAYTSNGPRVRAGLSRAWLADRLRVGVSWQLELLDIIDPAEEIARPVLEEIGLDGFYQLGLFEQSVVFDTRDNPLDARRGVYAEVRLREGGRYAGGEFSFVTITPELRGYLAASDRLTLAARVRYGQILSGAGLPVTERYFSGGASNHRGFPQRRLSPAALDQRPPEQPEESEPPPSAVPIGGEALLETSAEARVDLFHFREQWVGMAFFIDGGRVTTRPEILDPFAVTELYWAAGTGLRYDTPVGPLRVDVGYRLNHHGRNPLVTDHTVWNRLAFHLSIGEAF